MRSAICARMSTDSQSADSPADRIPPAVARSPAAGHFVTGAQGGQPPEARRQQ
jgi:hypothetical protein